MEALESARGHALNEIPLPASRLARKVRVQRAAPDVGGRIPTTDAVEPEEQRGRNERREADGPHR